MAERKLDRRAHLEAITMESPEHEGEDGFDVSEEQRALLLESLEQACRGEGVDGWKLVEELRSRYLKLA